MTRRSRALVAAAAAALVAATTVATLANAGGGTASSSMARGLGLTKPVGHIRYLGPTDPSARIQFQAVLRLPGQARLDRFLRRAYDPSAPGPRHFLKPNQFGAMFGLPLSELARLRRTLTAAGFVVQRTFAERTTLDLEGSAAALRRVFGIRLGEFRSPQGLRFHAPMNRPEVPANLRADVQGVSGLNTGLQPVPADIPAGGLRSSELAKAYDIAPLHDQGVQGQGQTIAIVSFATFRQSDIDLFEQKSGITAPRPVQHIQVDGGTTDLHNGNVIEDNLDLDAVEAVAPQAQILNYQGPTAFQDFTKGVVDIVHKIVVDSPRTGVHIASMSYGICDEPSLANGTPGVSGADKLAASREFQLAAAAGISVFVSSGDSGAFECQRNDLADIRPVPSWPADDPNVIAVGGTLLSVRKDGSYLSETGWEDQLELAGAGGGDSPTFARPSYQQGPGVNVPCGGATGPIKPACSNGKRQVPDVAGPADPDSGLFIVFPDPKTLNPVETIVGGTSAAAPFWAGSMILVQQFAKQQGAGPLGFVNPMFYQLAASKQTASAFHDVTLGGDRLNTCTPGWDFATGLGSPDVATLADDVVAFRKAHPAPK